MGAGLTGGGRVPALTPPPFSPWVPLRLALAGAWHALRGRSLGQFPRVLRVLEAVGRAAPAALHFRHWARLRLGLQAAVSTPPPFPAPPAPRKMADTRPINPWAVQDGRRPSQHPLDPTIWPTPFPSSLEPHKMAAALPIIPHQTRPSCPLGGHLPLWPPSSSSLTNFPFSLPNFPSFCPFYPLISPFTPSVAIYPLSSHLTPLSAILSPWRPSSLNGCPLLC